MIFGQEALDGNINRVVDFSTTENDVLELVNTLINYDPVTDAISDFISLKLPFMQRVLPADWRILRWPAKYF